MINTIFVLSLFAATSLILLASGSVASKQLQFWPPPSAQSWQNRIFWLLFRVMFLGIVILSILDFGSLQTQTSWWRYALGTPLAIFGFAAAFYITFYLGWKNAHGEKKGLQTTGWYRWSRNPIYVVTIVGIVGLGMLVSSVKVWVLLSIWIIFYLIAPILEEPWLEQQYGADFLAYKNRVPRFVGLIKN